MRFLLGAAAALVLVGNALAAPDLSPTDPTPSDPAPAGGELPVKATRRPAARLVPHRLEGKTAPAAKPSPTKSGATPKKPVTPKKATPKKVIPKKAATKTTMPARKGVAAKGTVATKKSVPVRSVPAKTVPAKLLAAGKANAVKYAPVHAGAEPKPLAAKHPATGKTASKPHPAAKAAAFRKPVAVTKSPVTKIPTAKHAAATKTKPGLAKPHPPKPIAAKVAKTVAPKSAVAKKAVPGKAMPKGAVVVRMGAPKAERGAVQAKYDAMSHLIMRRDGPRLAALFMGMTTPDFVYRDKKGKALNRNQLVGQLKAQMKMVKAFKQSSNKVVGFGLKGTGGVAQIVSQFAMVFPNGKKSVSVAGQSVTADTWVKTPKGWRLRAIRTLRESVKYNGKAV